MKKLSLATSDSSALFQHIQHVQIASHFFSLVGRPNDINYGRDYFAARLQKQSIPGRRKLQSLLPRYQQNLGRAGYR
jgi:hypothetical protein